MLKYMYRKKVEEIKMKNGKFEKKDLDDLNEIYKNNGPMTCGEFVEFVDDEASQSKNTKFWEVVQESISDTETLFLYDVRDKDGYSSINDIMETLHYDNGEPLTCDDYNYFDHYDRDQDFWGFYEDELIDHFELDKDGNIIQIMVMNKDELTDILTDMYDGSSWNHDFGN